MVTTEMYTGLWELRIPAPVLSAGWTIFHTSIPAPALPQRNALFINGQRLNLVTTANTWLPESTTVKVSETPCYSAATFSVSPGVPVRDDNNNIYLVRSSDRECRPGK